MVEKPMTSIKPAACGICGDELEQPEVGRPRRYCGPACRRMAERRVRIAEQLLTRALKAEQDAMAHLAAAPGWDEWEKRAAYWRGESVRLDAELRDLLNEDPGDDVRAAAKLLSRERRVR
jgi:hypothetical protein